MLGSAGIENNGWNAWNWFWKWILEGMLGFLLT